MTYIEGCEVVSALLTNLLKNEFFSRDDLVQQHLQNSKLLLLRLQFVVFLIFRNHLFLKQMLQVWALGQY